MTNLTDIECLKHIDFYDRLLYRYYRKKVIGVDSCDGKDYRRSE